MGGSIAVAIREQTGKVHCHDQWTNHTPYWFKDLRMREGDPVIIKEYLDQVKEQQKEQHGYGSPIPLAPSGYGLIVLDFVTNHFLVMQNYTDYNSFSEIDALGPVKGEEMKEIFKVNAERGLLTLELPIWQSGDHAGTLKTTIEQLPAESAMKRAAEVYDMCWGAGYRANRDAGMTIMPRFVIDMKPMTFIEYNLTNPGAKKFKTKLIELGFKINPEAEQYWKAWRQ